jgi:hypothetical protein
MPILPAPGQPITFSQIQSFVSSTYSVGSTSLRTLSNAAGKGAPDSMSEFAAIPITIWARNRFTLSNSSNAISIKYQISTSYNAFNFSTLTTQSIGTNYVNMGTILVDPGEITSTKRLRIGCQFTQSGGGIINVPFGQGNGGTNWTFYCGITAGGHYALTTTPTDIYLNINVSSGQYPSCG